MTQEDVYESLYELYAIFDIGMIADSFKEVLRAQFTPTEADLAVKVGFEGKKFDQIQSETGMEPKKLKKMLYTMGDKGTIWIDPATDDPSFKTVGLAGPGLIETGGWGNIRFPNSVQVMKALHKLEVDSSIENLVLRARSELKGYAVNK